jgi:hypothetical protein
MSNQCGLNGESIPKISIIFLWEQGLVLSSIQKFLVLKARIMIHVRDVRLLLLLLAKISDQLGAYRILHDVLTCIYNGYGIPKKALFETTKYGIRRECGPKIPSALFTCYKFLLFSFMFRFC